MAAGFYFLCTTGAEALYSDMSHCGRNNIRVSWSFIKVMLLLSSAGQTVWVLQHTGETTDTLSPFFHSEPEAIRLQVWPRHRVHFPGDVKGQLYIPFINWLLMAGCIGIVLHFRESTAMEAAFGLSVTLTMLMSTFLLYFYLRSRLLSAAATAGITAIFLSIEMAFLIANLQKISEGGWITLMIGAVLFAVMFVWYRGRRIKKALVNFQPVEKYLPLIKQLSEDQSIPIYATNLVYLTASQKRTKLEQKILDAILFGVPSGPTCIGL